jgi:hypothetical protein
VTPLVNTSEHQFETLAARPAEPPDDTPPGVFGASDLSNRKIIAVPWTPMATKTGKLADSLATYIAAGVLAFLILLLAGKAGWTLWVIGPAAVLIGLYLVHSPRRQRRLSAPQARPIKPPKAGSRAASTDRRAGWNSLGTLTVRADDPYVVVKGESPPDGVAVPVAPGRWQVHVRSELVTAPPVHMRDAELRIVQDPRWVTEDWEWTLSWEPLLTGHLGSTSQSGRIAVDAGLLKVQAGRKARPSKALDLQPGFADGAFGVNVVRDLSGNVVAVVSRFG